MSSNSVTLTIGTSSDLTPLFAYQPAGVALKDGIAHTINQTLLRDLFYGAWAQVWPQSSKPTPLPTDQYRVTITSPHAHHDLTGYATKIPAFIAAVRTGLGIYNANKTNLPVPPTVSFLPPFGLSMLNTKSIQLLHYPPSETLEYMDYLYSPTNRRWENLLGYNAYPGAENTLVETIVDVIPIAANGTDGATQLKPVEGKFASYVQQMLNVYLRPSPGGKATQPVVAYGGPVMAFLETAFNQSGLEVGSVISLQLIPGGPATPVLCANHPDRFLMAAGKHETPASADPKAQYPPQDPKAILLQDLKAARWQVTMAKDPDADPVKTWNDVSEYWDQNPPRVDQILAEQMAEFER